MVIQPHLYQPMIPQQPALPSQPLEPLDYDVIEEFFTPPSSPKPSDSAKEMMHAHLFVLPAGPFLREIPELSKEKSPDPTIPFLLPEFPNPNEEASPSNASSLPLPPEIPVFTFAEVDRSKWPRSSRGFLVEKKGFGTLEKFVSGNFAVFQRVSDGILNVSQLLECLDIHHVHANKIYSTLSKYSPSTSVDHQVHEEPEIRGFWYFFFLWLPKKKKRKRREKKRNEIK